MAMRTLVLLTDDLDGTDAEESVTFSLDGVSYEIDLSAENAESMRAAFAKFVDAGRRTGGRQARGSKNGTSRKVANGSLNGTRLKELSKEDKSSITPTRIQLPDVKPPLDRRDRSAVQKFAAANGMRVPGDRGRVASDVRTAWEEAGSPR